jgi:hypothetical protein
MANPTRRTRMLITGLLAGCLLGSLPRVIAQSAQPTQSDSASPATQTAVKVVPLSITKEKEPGMAPSQTLSRKRFAWTGSFGK